MFDLDLGLLALLLAAFALAGLTVTLAGRAPQLRGLALALRPSRARRRLLAGLGLASVTGGTLALAAAGPGAIAWWWLAGLLGGGLHWAEARLSSGASSMFDGAGRFGHALKFLSASTGIAAALAAGALLHAQQGAEVLREGLGLAGWAAGPLLAGLLLAVLLLARRRRSAVDGAAPIAILIYVGLALAALLAAPGALEAGLRDMAQGAWSGEAALAGTLAAAAQAVLWSSVAAGPGLGAGEGAGDDPPGSLVTAAPLSAVVATATALLLLAAGDPRAPVVAQDASLVGPPGAVALERHLGVGLEPSDYGQTVVLAPDLGLEPGKRYEVVFRADPRGHKAGEVLPGDNIVVLPAWAVAADVDEVILRDKDPERAKNPGFDVRIACTRERVDTRVGEFIKLKPRDPNINILQLMKARDLAGPYVPLADYHFVASVRPAVALDTNQTQLLLYEEPRPADAPRDPILRELVALGYAGPYLDPGGATTAPPLAFAAAPQPGPEPVPGDRLHLRLDAPERGIALGFVNRLGELEVPPWDFLTGARVAILHHPDDPALDVRVPVVSRLAFGRLRFFSLDPTLAFDALRERFPDHSPPHLVSPSYRFAVEVRSGARVPSPRTSGPVLVPLHPELRPRGNPGFGLYTPHPAEVMAAGMSAPVRDQFGAAQILPGLTARLGRPGAIAGALALVALALAGLVFWLRRSQRWALACFGGGEFAVTLAFLVAVVAGPACDPAALLHLALPAVALTAVLGLTAVAVQLPRLARMR